MIARAVMQSCQLHQSLCAGLSLSITSVVAGPALAVLTTIARCLSAITIRKLCKNKVLLFTGPGNCTAHLGPHCKVMGRERERESAWAWGSAFIAVGGGGVRVLQAQSLVVNLTYKGQNLKHGERKNK